MKQGIKNQQTKQEIVASFEDWLEEKPLDRITITDITERSGVSRQMFYHYFSDRIQLVRWVCRKYVQTPLYEEDLFVWKEALERLLASKKEYGEYYCNILHSRYAIIAEEVLCDELYTLFHRIIRYRICRTLPKEMTDALRNYCIFCARRIMEDFAAVSQTSGDIYRQLLQEMPKGLYSILCEYAISVKVINADRSLLSWAYD